MAAELVETSRLWARMVARVEPEWVEPLAEHLVKRAYSEPRWDRDQGAVLADERVTLYGVPLVARRTVRYGRVDPELARELFIRHALVEGDWDTRHRFFHDNRRLLGEVEELEHRARRRDILVDEQTLFDFYDRRVGREVVSARHFDSWWKAASATRPELLSFEKSMLVKRGADRVDERDYPDCWQKDGHELRLSYQFEPGTEADGVTVHVPLPVLNQVTADGFDWQVPGLREELVTALVRSLPKPLRRNLVPAPDHARAALGRLAPGDGPLLDALARELQRTSGVAVPPGSFELDRVPAHLKVTFRVTDERHRTVGEGKDLDALKLRLRSRMRAAISAAADGLERGGLRTWSVGELPRTVERRRGGRTVKAYPALVDEGGSVAVRLLETEAEQRRAMAQGTRRLLLLGVPSPVRSVLGRLTNAEKMTLSQYPHGSATELFDDCIACAVDALVAEAGGPAWDSGGFARLHATVRAGLDEAVLDVVATVERILAAAREVAERLEGPAGPALAPALADARAQLSGLVYRGFVGATGRRRLADVLRYVRAIGQRLEKLPHDPGRDRERMLDVEELERSYRGLLAELPPGRPVPEALRQVRWMLEELRVSYFAQTLGTPAPVSAKRVRRAMEQLAS